MARHLWVAINIILVCVLKFALGSPTALSIRPSEFWDGADGRWSTFLVQVGTPGQQVRLLPSTSASAGTGIWVVITEGCTLLNANLSDCSSQRGYLFSPNTSTTYSTQQLLNAGNGTIFTLNTVHEGALGLQGYAYYGFDTVSLGVEGSGLPTLQNQVIAAYAINTFWVGTLGLSPLPTNFTNLVDAQPSMLGTLRESNLIPSTSWVYAAGAYYTNPPMFDSLTLGGFDQSRFEPNNVSYAFGADITRDLFVSLRSITSSLLGAPPLLADDIEIFIDSLVTELWLPVSVYRAFEQQFQLVWNSAMQMYLVDDRTHQALLASNASFTFTLAQPGITGEQQPFVDIVLPYFPLKRAQDEGQYTLGRVFLQEAYIIADYERTNFSISQALFPPTSTPQKVVSIEPPARIELNSNNTTQQSDGSSEDGEQNNDGLDSGTIAGIVVGAVAAVALTLAIGILLMRRLRKRAAADTSEQKSQDAEPKNDADNPSFPEIDVEDTAIRELDHRNALKAELGDGQTHGTRHELESENKPAELLGERITTAELQV